MTAPNGAAALERLLEHGLIGALDLHFARFLGTLAAAQPDAALAAALLSRAVGEGHTCLDLRETAGFEVLGYEFIDGARFQAVPASEPVSGAAYD